jgi:hypothetical protein
MLAALARRVWKYRSSVVAALAGLAVWLGMTTAAARGVQVTSMTSPIGPARVIRWYGWPVAETDHPIVVNPPDEFVTFALWGLCGFASLAVAVPAWKLAAMIRGDVQRAGDQDDTPGGQSTPL